MKLQAFLLFLMLAVASPVAATKYQVRYTGKVTLVEGDAQGSGINVGDNIAAQFLFDEALVGVSTFLPIGGGSYTTYVAPISMFTLAAGSYTQSRSDIETSLTYADDSFGQDMLVFTVVGLAGGPFGSNFASVQFQARGADSALDGRGISNGLPYARLMPSFFAIFSESSTAKRVFGDVEVSVSAVPEPANWRLIILGFGILGYAIRNNRIRETLAIA